MLDSRMKLAAGIENEEMLEEIKSSPDYSKPDTGRQSMRVLHVLVGQCNVFQHGDDFIKF